MKEVWKSDEISGGMLEGMRVEFLEGVCDRHGVTKFGPLEEDLIYSIQKHKKPFEFVIETRDHVVPGPVPKPWAEWVKLEGRIEGSNAKARAMVEVKGVALGFRNDHNPTMRSAGKFANAAVMEETGFYGQLRHSSGTWFVCPGRGTSRGSKGGFAKVRTNGKIQYGFGKDPRNPLIRLGHQIRSVYEIDENRIGGYSFTGSSNQEFIEMDIHTGLTVAYEGDDYEYRRQPLFWGSVGVPGGVGFLLPWSAERLGRVDPVEKKWEFFGPLIPSSMNGNVYDPEHYQTGVYCERSGLIGCFPKYGRHLMIIDPKEDEEDAVSFVRMPDEIVEYCEKHGTSVCWGQYVGPDGLLYSVPNKAPFECRVDLTRKELTTEDIEFRRVDEVFAQAEMHPGGKGYGYFTEALVMGDEVYLGSGGIQTAWKLVF